ncbi:hypothetical protein CRG98_012441 [Punica granatum]|uniref:Uncharacterized protein n=1 Tax=Punica granatum TaxID=22663 RepID=A0A2I0KFB1_PUNGR|nr:hypothetical protein CRG98_012441 [Punica granatum]
MVIWPNINYEFYVRWSVIASQLPGRTDNDVKNYWNTKLKKKLLSGKINLPTSNNSISTTNNGCSSSSLGTNSEFVPAPQNYNYQGFWAASEAKVDPAMYSALLTNVQYGPSLNSHSPSAEIGSFVDFRGNIKPSVSQECSSTVNSSGNSPNSLGMVDYNRSVSFSGNGRITGEDGGMNFGFGFSWDMINELLFDEKLAGEISPNALAEVNPQVLNQSSINFQY